MLALKRGSRLHEIAWSDVRHSGIIVSSQTGNLIGG